MPFGFLGSLVNRLMLLMDVVLQFLSMKLATVNPRLDFNIDSLLPKDVSICFCNVILGMGFSFGVCSHEMFATQVLTWDHFCLDVSIHCLLAPPCVPFGFLEASFSWSRTVST